MKRKGAPPAASSSGFTVDALGRKKWDKEFFKKQAEEEAEKLLQSQQTAQSATKPLERAPLTAEDIEKTRRAAGLHCAVCNVTLRDSQTFYDHINGKAHNRALGMTMQVIKASPEEVKNKLLIIRRRLYPDE